MFSEIILQAVLIAIMALLVAAGFVFESVKLSCADYEKGLRKSGGRRSKSLAAMPKLS